MPIAALLAQLGFVAPGERALARAALETAKLTRPGKEAISREKLPRVRELLADRFALACTGCSDATTSERPGAELVIVTSQRCERCAGSGHRAAALRFLAACSSTGVRRVVSIGGNPASRKAAGAQLPELDLECIDGTRPLNARRARSLIDGADLVIVWGGTELDHSVSDQFAAPKDKWKVTVAQKRGLAALLDAGTKHLELRG